MERTEPLSCDERCFCCSCHRCLWIPHSVNQQSNRLVAVLIHTTFAKTVHGWTTASPHAHFCFCFVRTNSSSDMDSFPRLCHSLWTAHSLVVCCCLFLKRVFPFFLFLSFSPFMPSCRKPTDPYHTTTHACSESTEPNSTYHWQ